MSPIEVATAVVGEGGLEPLAPALEPLRTGVVRAALWIAGLGVLTVIVFRRVADPRHT